MRRSRTPEIMADAAYAIVTKPSRSFTGNFLIDDTFLYGEGERNFDRYRVVRMNESPTIDITLVQSNEKPGGIGEPATALIGPAVANAVFAATGKRVRRMPFTAENIASA